MQPFSGRASHPENKQGLLSFYSKSVTPSLICPKRGVSKPSGQSGQSAAPIDHIAKFRLTRGGQLANVSQVWVESAKKGKLSWGTSWQPPLGGRWSTNGQSTGLQIYFCQSKYLCKLCKCSWAAENGQNICDGTGCFYATTPHSDQHSNSMDGQMARWTLFVQTGNLDWKLDTKKQMLTHLSLQISLQSVLQNYPHKKSLSCPWQNYCVSAHLLVPIPGWVKLWDRWQKSVMGVVRV